MRVPKIASRLSGRGEESDHPANQHFFAAEVSTGVCTVSHESHVSHAYAPAPPGRFISSAPRPTASACEGLGGVIIDISYLR